MKFPKRDLPSANSGGSSLFLKLKDGESKVGVFKGEVYEFFQVWENNRSRVVGPDDQGAKSRFRLNFITKEDGEMKARIFEFGLVVYGQLADLSDEYDLEKTAVRITRRGLGTDTTYTIIPAKEQPTAAQLKSMDSILLNNLEHKDSQAPKIKNHAPGADDDEGLPF